MNVLDESARFSIQGRVKRGDNSNRRQLSVTLWLRVNIHATQQKKKASQTTTTIRDSEQPRSLFLFMNQQRKLGTHRCFIRPFQFVFPPPPIFSRRGRSSTVLQHVFFKSLFINIPRGAILKPSTPTSSNEWNSLFLSSFFSCFEIVNFPDLSWIWILPPFRIKNASKSKNLYSKIRIPRFYSQIKLFDLTATKPHTNTHTCIYKDTKKIEIQRIERN